MMTFPERTEMNLMLEAKVYVFDAVPLSKRENADAVARRDQHVQDFKGQWEEQFKRPWSFGDTRQREIKPWTPEQRKTIQERLVKRLASMEQRLELTHEEAETWLDWANGLYEITVDNSVISYASSDVKNNKPYEWQYQDESHAEDQVVDLLCYKITDRKRGRGNVDADLGNLTPLV
jgi:hypothetical protein